MHCLWSSALVIICTSMLANACERNTVCTKSRDTIVQSNSGITLSERMRNSSRIWYISPRIEAFNAILAFKNFSSDHSAVIVVAYDHKGETTTRHLYGNLGNLEIVLPSTMAVIIYVPINLKRSAEFVLHYYAGCSILTAAQDKINHALVNHKNQQGTNCWLIHPLVSDHRKRIYLSLRKVKLAKEQKINIWDLHTSNTIKETREEDYDLIGAESSDGRYQQSIMVDFESSIPFERRNQFFIAYYTMTQNDSSCIEKKKACFGSDTKKNCDFECPALNKMIIEEYNTFEEYNFQSGKKQISLTRAEKNSSKCILPEKYCRCPKTIPKRYFCFKKVKCLRMGRCMFACIYHKLTTCLEIRRLSSVTLL